jgi:hypothetical protein
LTFPEPALLPCTAAFTLLLVESYFLGRTAVQNFLGPKLFFFLELADFFDCGNQEKPMQRVLEIVFHSRSIVIVGFRRMKMNRFNSSLERTRAATVTRNTRNTRNGGGRKQTT